MPPVETFSQIVVPELNFLLTEPPFDAEGGRDFGLFCREHAYCSCVIARLLGLRLKIVRGDLTVRSCGRVIMTTVGTDSDHAWCRTPLGQIVDASMTLQYYSVPQIEVPLAAVTQSGPYRILAEESEQSVEPSEIRYRLRTTIDTKAEDLVMDPTQIFPRHHVESPIICNQIVAHIARMLHGDRLSFRGTRSQQLAHATLANDFPTAKSNVERLVSKAPKVAKWT